MSRASAGFGRHRRGRSAAKTRRLRAWALQWLWGAALAGAPATAVAQVVTLQWVERKALTAPEAVAQERAQRAAAAAETRARASRYRPQLGAELSAAVAPGGVLVEIADSTGQNYLVPGTLALGQSDALVPLPRYGATLGLEYGLYSFGRKRLDEQLSRAKLTALTQSQRAAAQARVAAARAAYLGWLGSHVTQGVTERARAQAEAHQRRVSGLVEEGVLSALDALEAERGDQNAALRLRRATLANETARGRLESVLGTAIGPTASPETALLTEEEEPIGAGPSLPEPLAAQSRLAELSAERAEREGGPWLGLNATAGVRGQQDSLFPVYRAAVTARVPLWDGGGRDARAEALRARAAELRLQARAKQQGMELRGARLRAQLLGLAEEIAMARQVVVLSERVVEQRRESLELGASDFEHLAAAQNQRVTAELELLASRLERLRVRLECRGWGGCSPAKRVGPSRPSPAAAPRGMQRETGVQGEEGTGL